MKKRGVKAIVGLMTTICMTVTLTACGQTANTTGADQSGAAGGSGGSKKIGMTILDLSNPFFVALTNAAKKEAQSKGYELIINDPKNDVNAQVNAIDDFIAQKVAAIIVTATDQKVIDSEVKKARDAGIPVIAHTTKLSNETAWVGSDEYKMGDALGEQAGQWIKDVYNGKGEIGILNFDQIEQVKQRKQGIEDGIHKYAPDVKVVADQQAGDPATGLKVAEGFLQAHPNLIGIFGINDGGALGAYNAAKAAGKDPAKFAVGGIDTVPEAIAAIKENGIYKFTVNQQPVLTGQTCVDVAVKAINHESVNQENEIPVQPVNKSNVNQF